MKNFLFVIAILAASVTAWAGATSSTGILQLSGSGTGGTAFGAIAPIVVYVKSVPVLTSGSPADIASITIPSAILRWCITPASGSIITASRSGGDASAGTFQIFDTAGGAGKQMGATQAFPSAINKITAGTGSSTDFSTGTTIYIRQISNSASSATESFYITLTPVP
jgi:hypothetical protein